MNFKHQLKGRDSKNKYKTIQNIKNRLYTILVDKLFNIKENMNICYNNFYRTDKFNEDNIKSILIISNFSILIL